MAERNVKEYINGLVQRAKVAQKEFERTALDQLTIDKVVRAIGKTVVDAKEELRWKPIWRPSMAPLR